MSKVNWTRFALMGAGEKYTTLREAGYKRKNGLAAENGKAYYPAREGGGYESTAIAVKHAVQIEQGCPAYHATVGILPL